MSAARAPVSHSASCGGASSCARRTPGSSAFVVRKSRAVPFAASPASSTASTATTSTASTPSKTMDLGDDLGWRTDFDRSYVKGKVLGQGSFGVVHLGINMRTGSEVAVKVMPKMRNKLSKERTLEKIVRETEILERLQPCSGVVQLEDCFEDDASVAMILEFCGGGDLHKFVETNGALDERGLVLVAREVLKVVNACHNLGILHGDVKPANFCLKNAKKNPLVDPKFPASEPWLKALDFGCSQRLPIPSKPLTKRTGTPVFMAPEIYEREYGPLVDVWSIGVMLYWLFSQRFPFFPDAESVKVARFEDVNTAVCFAPMDYNYGPWPTMSPEGLDFIQRCLQRDGRKRITVAQALLHPWLTTAVQGKGKSSVGKGNASAAA